MPDVASLVVVVVPVCLAHTLPYFCGCKILVRAKHLQCLVLVIGNGVITQHLVSHRDRQQVGSYALPVVYLLVVEVCPMEVERRGEVL